MFLTNYLESKGENCVININAPWGSGKTFFLKKWFDDVKKEHPAVYFNAWENDYSDDSLISIISCVNKEIIPLLPESVEKVNTTKNCNGLIKPDTSKDRIIMSSEVNMSNQNKHKRPKYTLEFKQDAAKLVNEKAIRTSRPPII